MNGFSVFLCAVAVIASVSATDYCSSSICNSGVAHIACGHSGNFATTCPSDAAMVDITPTLQNVVVTSTNTYRNLIATGGHANHSIANRMATIQWDPELASIASLNVKQCAMAHDKCRNTDDFKYSGQNLAWMGYFGTPNDASMLKQAVDMWYSEVKDSKMEYIDAYPNGYTGPAIGHFTVMMADRNVRVGCAAATYSVTGASYKAYLVACNYATTNMINFPIYARGTTAGAGCTTGTNPAYSGLCSTSEVYTVNKWF